MYPQQEHNPNYANKMTTTNGSGLAGSSTPKVASPLENEVQGLFDSTYQLTEIVKVLFERLTPALRQPELKDEVSGKNQSALSPLPHQIRENKEVVFMNVFAIKNLLDRLEI